MSRHTSDLGRHGRNVSWVLLVDLFWKAVSVFYFAYIFAKLSKAENERYALFVSVLPMLMVVNAFGFQDVVNREVAKRREEVHRLMGSALAVQFALFAVGAAVAWPLGCGLEMTAGTRWLVMTWPVAAFLATAVEMHSALFAAHERFKELSLITMTTRMVSVGGSLCLLYAGYGVNALVAYATMVYAVQLGLSHAVFRVRCGGYRARPSLEAVRYLFREGTQMALGRVAATSFYRIDLPALRLIGTPLMAMEYAVGPRFFALLTTIPNTFESISFPILSRKASPAGDSPAFVAERFFKLAWMVAAPMAVGMTLTGSDIVRTLAGESYVNNVPVVVMFTWLVALAMLDRVAVVYLRASGRQGTVMRIYGVALAAKSALCLPAIYLWGIQGLLALNILCSGCVTIYVMTKIDALIPGVRPRAVVTLALRPAAACAAMAGALWLVRGQPIYLTIPLGAAVYGAALLGLGALDDFDRRFISRTLQLKRPAAEPGAEA